MFLDAGVVLLLIPFFIICLMEATTVCMHVFLESTVVEALSTFWVIFYSPYERTICLVQLYQNACDFQQDSLFGVYRCLSAFLRSSSEEISLEIKFRGV